VKKKFENRLKFGELMGKSLVSCFFLTHGVVAVIARLLVSVILHVSFAP